MYIEVKFQTTFCKIILTVCIESNVAEMLYRYTLNFKNFFPVLFTQPVLKYECRKVVNKKTDWHTCFAFCLNES